MAQPTQTATRRAGGNEGNKQRVARRSLVVSVKDIDPETEIMRVEDDRGEFEVKIDPEVIDRVKKPHPEQDYEGYCIDQRLYDLLLGDNASSEPKVLIEALRDPGYRGTGQRSPYLARWFRAPPRGDASYFKSGMITARGNPNQDRIYKLLRWSSEAVNPESERFTKIRDKLDQQHEQWQEAKAAGTNIPRVQLGYAVRVIEGDQVVATSPPIDWNREEQRLPTGADLESEVEAWQNEYGGAEQGRHVEVVPLQSLTPSKDLAMDGATKLRVQLKAREAVDAEMPKYGNALVGSEGVLVLNAGKLDRQGNVQRNGDYVNALKWSSTVENVHNRIATSDGQQVQVHEALEPERIEGRGRAQADQQEAATTRAEGGDAADTAQPEDTAQAAPADDAAGTAEVDDAADADSNVTDDDDAEAAFAGLPDDDPEDEPGMTA